jgi:hypothetical protein
MAATRIGHTDCTGTLADSVRSLSAFCGRWETLKTCAARRESHRVPLSQQRNHRKEYNTMKHQLRLILSFALYCLSAGKTCPANLIVSFTLTCFHLVKDRHDVMTYIPCIPSKYRNIPGQYHLHSAQSGQQGL